MESKGKLYFWIFVLVVFISLLVIVLNGGITGNPVYKTYNINDFPGIYVDFGPSQTEGSLKWGSAAVGSFGEYWNSPFLEDSSYTFYPLRYANGDLSNMRIQLSNLDKNGYIKSNLGDIMFESYIYSENINKVSSITVSNLISGNYDIYLYGNLENSNANYELYRYIDLEDETKSVFLGLKSTYVNSDVLLKEVWYEGIHYVVYRDIKFEEGNSFEIIVKSFDNTGERTNSFISGMQLVKSGTKIAYNQTTLSKDLDCYDSDEGINYTLKGKIYVNGRYSSEDLCDNNNEYLTELYCENGIKTIQSYKCENGCVDGFCVSDYKFSECDGCLFNQICISRGTRVDNKYCDIDKFLKIQKNEDGFCKNNFECFTNSCLENKCESLEDIAKRELGIKYNFVNFICRLTNLNSINYQECLDDSFSPLLDENKESEIIIDDKINENNQTENNYSSNPLPDISLN